MTALIAIVLGLAGVGAFVIRMALAGETLRALTRERTPEQAEFIRNLRHAGVDFNGATARMVADIEAGTGEDGPHDDSDPDR